jgi:uncharacterized protein (TIRG00374 family)
MVTKITGLDRTVTLSCDNKATPPIDCNRSKIWFAGKLLIALLLVAYLFYTNKISLAALRGFLSWRGMLGGVGAVLLFMTAQVLTSLRIYYLFQSNHLDISFGRCLKTNFVGLFANNYLPTAIGGDAVRAYFFVQGRSGQVPPTIATIAYDRILGLLALALMAFTALGLARVWMPQLAWTPSLRWIFTLLGAGLGSAAGVMFISRSALILRWMQHLCAKIPFGEFLAGFLRAYNYLSRNNRILLLLLVLSFLSHTCCALALYSIGRGLGLHTGLGLTILLAPLIFFSGLLPVSPGNLGWTEYVGSWLWSSQGFAWGGSLWLAYRAVTVAVSLIGLIFYLQSKARKPRNES